MVSDIIKIGRNFWNIRSTFKLCGILDVGTHASLVKCKDGRFILLDTCEMSEDTLLELDKLTLNGELLKAIINLHPFHTASVGEIHELYPDAELYGTERHKLILPDLPWQKLNSEDDKLHRKFAADLEFSVPEGVDFVSDNDSVHFSSVLVYHPLSKTIHVDDTLMFVPMPKMVGALGLKNALSFHPTLTLALEKHPEAALEFENWVNNLVERWGGAQGLCAAHTSILLDEGEGKSIVERILKALKNVKWILLAHRLRYGYSSSRL
jgi:hypothetical protein